MSEPEESGPILSVEGYEGPLDWLLEMVRARKIDLAKLSILALITAFAAALETALAGPEPGAATLSRPLSRWGDWLVMASNLTLLRSRLLLPVNAAEAKAAAEEADRLRRHLVSRAEIRAAADWLDRQPQLHRDVLPRGWAETHEGARVGDITGLLRACLAALHLPEGVEPYRPRPAPAWRMADAADRIGALLALVPEDGTPLAGFLPPTAGAAPQSEAWCRVAVAATFLAGLELAREARVVLEQPRPWAPIQLHRGPAGPVTA